MAAAGRIVCITYFLGKGTGDAADRQRFLEITQSVGATALGVAAARAAETESENPLINDPFARVFVDAAGEGMWSIYANPALLAKAADTEPDLRARLQLMVDFMATRTAFFDEFFLGAADAGVRQVVILAAGLDARSWRLPWPDGTVVYELDQPKVLEFNPTRCANTARSRPRSWSTCRSTCARIGRKRCEKRALMLRDLRCGRPKGSSATYRRRPRTCCSSGSIR